MSPEIGNHPLRKEVVPAECFRLLVTLQSYPFFGNQKNCSSSNIEPGSQDVPCRGAKTNPDSHNFHSKRSLEENNA
jgi:hypothetical protein